MNGLTTVLAAGESSFSVSSVLADVSTVVSKVVDACTGNPVTMAIIGMALVGTGVGLFRKFLRVGK